MHNVVRILKSIVLAPFWLFMGIGGGSQGSSNSSRPLTAAERYNAMAGALSAITGVSPDFGQSTETSYGPNGEQIVTVRGGDGNINNADAIIKAGLGQLQALGKYDSPATYDPGAARTLTNGDYTKLQSDILSGNTAALDAAKAQDLQLADSEAAKRGIWSSGLALKSGMDVAQKYAPQYAAAGANATQQRYNLQNAENQNTNTYNANRSQLMANQAQANAQAQYNAKWAPYNYLKDAYNGTGGTISSGGSSGWNFNI